MPVIHTTLRLRQMVHLVAIVVPAIIVVSALGQPGVLDEPDDSLRSKVREIAFPYVTTSKREAVITLRFAPSFSPESQISATIELDGSVSTEYRAASLSLDEAFRRLPISQRSPDAVARAMGVKRTSVSLPPDLVKGWFHEFWTALETSSRELAAVALMRLVQLDGTLYSCKYQEVPLEFNLQLPSSEVGYESADDPAIVKWMNKIRLTVQKRAGAGPSPER
jgi:hypothetical protein